MDFVQETARRIEQIKQVKIAAGNTASSLPVLFEDMVAFFDRNFVSLPSLAQVREAYERQDSPRDHAEYLRSIHRDAIPPVVIRYLISVVKCPTGKAFESHPSFFARYRHLIME